MVQNFDIFCQLAITHTIAIKWKEEYNAVVAFVWCQNKNESS